MRTLFTYPTPSRATVGAPHLRHRLVFRAGVAWRCALLDSPCRPSLDKNATKTQY